MTLSIEIYILYNVSSSEFIVDGITKRRKVGLAAKLIGCKKAAK